MKHDKRSIMYAYSGVVKSFYLYGQNLLSLGEDIFHREIDAAEKDGSIIETGSRNTAVLIGQLYTSQHCRVIQSHLPDDTNSARTGRLHVGRRANVSSFNIILILKHIKNE